MTAYCNKYKISTATGYRWVNIAMYESDIRQRIADLGHKPVKQSEMLRWIKEWKNNGIQKAFHLEMPLLQVS